MDKSYAEQIQGHRIRIVSPPSSANGNDVYVYDLDAQKEVVGVQRAEVIIEPCEQIIARLTIRTGYKLTVTPPEPILEHVIVRDPEIILTAIAEPLYENARG